MTSLIGLGAALSALVAPAHAAPRPQDDDEGLLPPARIRWSNPAAFSAQPTERDVFTSAGFYYGEHKGRKAEISEFTLGAGITPRLGVWYAHHDVVLKGRSSKSRFRTKSDTYGIRYLLQEVGVKPLGIAVEYETNQADPARATQATSGGSSLIQYPAPTVNSFRVITSNRKGVDNLFAYTRIEASGGLHADVLDLGIGRDKVISEKWTLRVQGHLVAQNFRGLKSEVSGEIRPVLYTGLAYRVSPNAQVETDLTFMPNGTPLAWGRLTSLTGYQLYEPSGVAEDLRKDAFGVFGLRVMLRKTF